MNTSRLGLMVLAVLCVSEMVFANRAPMVTNVTASQRTDGSGIVDIAYTLADADNDRCTITVQVSSDGGSTWTITPSAGALSGALTNVSPGRRIRVTANDGRPP
ncbi:MAG TPA: hypothetical protein VLH60_02685, partial [Sedimentisphaerales bacterium]|nr:hypothetical protein [Sedimentisphaerales bacterium]